MAIRFSCEEVSKPKLRYSDIKVWINQIANLHSARVGAISIIFCSDTYLLSINKQFLSHDYFTDIITFNYNEGDILSGDLFISCERVKDNADSFGADLKNEFLRVIIHGILHLLGFNDKTEEEEIEMRRLEEECLMRYFSISEE